jgi:hypothetical protein
MVSYFNDEVFCKWYVYDRSFILLPSNVYSRCGIIDLTTWAYLNSFEAWHRVFKITILAFIKADWNLGPEFEHVLHKYFLLFIEKKV